MFLSVDESLFQAKSLAEPFAFEEYRKKRIQEKIEEERANRVRLKVWTTNHRHLWSRAQFIPRSERLLGFDWWRSTAEMHVAVLIGCHLVPTLLNTSNNDWLETRLGIP